MFQIFIVIFRESMEIALLISIIMAVTKPIKNSGIYILLGVMIGIISASLFAFFTKVVSSAFRGIGDELLDSSIILITVFSIIWTIVWMQNYGYKMKRDIINLSDQIEAGTKSFVVLSVVVATTVFREGLEIVLYIYSISSAQKIQIDNYLLGLILGASGGILFGIVIYWGLIKFAGKYIFKISSMLLAFTAAGLASVAAGILTSSGIITIFSEQVWDSSQLIRANSLLGKFLRIIAGYDPRPNGLQIIFYLSTLGLILLLIQSKAIFFNKKNYYKNNNND